MENWLYKVTIAGRWHYKGVTLRTINFNRKGNGEYLGANWWYLGSWLSIQLSEEEHVKETVGKDDGARTYEEVIWYVQVF